MNDRKEYIDKFAKQLKQWDSDMQVLQEKLRNQTSNAKIELQKQLNNLESQKNILKLKLDKLNDSNSEVWKDIREGTEKSWTEFKGKIENLSSKFN